FLNFYVDQEETGCPRWSRSQQSDHTIAATILHHATASEFPTTGDSSHSTVYSHLRHLFRGRSGLFHSSTHSFTLVLSHRAGNRSTALRAPIVCTNSRTNKNRD
ncbi:hypothetical protein PFISCL1PPCAC_25913, partial [Pristionchus fissidentatus]